MILAFKLVLRLSDSLVDERFRGAGRQSKPQPFGFVFLCYGILVADHKIQHPSLFLNASRDVFMNGPRSTSFPRESREKK